MDHRRKLCSWMSAVGFRQSGPKIKVIDLGIRVFPDKYILGRGFLCYQFSRFLEVLSKF